MNLRPLPGPFGMEIQGIDLAQSLATPTITRLIDLLYENRIIVIRGQTLAPARYLMFGELFGHPHPHVLSHRRMDGFPAIMTVTNVSRPGAPFINGASHWHTDQSYETEPSSATLLYSVKAPIEGAQTRYADMIRAYDSLDEATKRRIEHLQVEHLYGAGIAAGEEEQIPSPLVNKVQTDSAPMVRHPLVRTHPATGRKTLYSPCGTSRGIVGMSRGQARKLLRQLTQHALKPNNQYWHQHRRGDVIVWDTAATIHMASPNQEATGELDTRVLHRISVKGPPPSLLAAPTTYTSTAPYSSS